MLNYDDTLFIRTLLMEAWRYRGTLLSFFIMYKFFHNVLHHGALARSVHLAVNSLRLVKEVGLKDQRVYVKYQVPRYEVKTNRASCLNALVQAHPLIGATK